MNFPDILRLAGLSSVAKNEEILQKDHNFCHVALPSRGEINAAGPEPAEPE